MNRGYKVCGEERAGTNAAGSHPKTAEKGGDVWAGTGLWISPGSQVPTKYGHIEGLCSRLSRYGVG